ncbi:DUF6221 family protein [Arthrobacter sp. PsM3]|uniref:DUF6221 family protein n=1 Tax=Arthrobacter sp. PsM3 TaxID=3030531 RepID=UPI00263BC77C|nr:DUF6221 family protein [Arthrobacter sp. PsM3]MDN4643404.1 DUF6221 family protein [Arthrobacter sp. PsM3]
MDIVGFLEARIAERESAIREGSFVLRIFDDHENGSEDNSSLGKRMLAECAQKRAIVASWKEAADAEGISDPSEAEGTVAIARRAMLTILAGSYREHPDYEQCWSSGLPTDIASESAKE